MQKLFIKTYVNVLKAKRTDEQRTRNPIRTMEGSIWDWVEKLVVQKFSQVKKCRIHFLCIRRPDPTSTLKMTYLILTN